MTFLQELARFILDTAVDLYLLILWMRFLLQAMGADFYAPLSQFTVQATRPLVDPLDRLFQRKAPAGVIPLRRHRPSRWSFGALLLIVLIKLLHVSVVSWLVYRQQPPAVLTAFISFLNVPGAVIGGALGSIRGLLPMVVNFYVYAIILGAILSWVAPHNPNAGTIQLVTEPVLAPCRRILPPMSGLDLSPLVAYLGLRIVEFVLVKSIIQISFLLRL